MQAEVLDEADAPKLPTYEERMRALKKVLTEGVMREYQRLANDEQRRTGGVLTMVRR